MSLTYVFLICTVVPLLFGLWAQFQVKSTFKRYSQVAVASGMTGAQAADAVLRNSGVSGVGIRPVAGQLSDHYDPRSKTLNLSEDVGGVAGRLLRSPNRALLTSTSMDSDFASKCRSCRVEKFRTGPEEVRAPTNMAVLIACLST